MDFSILEYIYFVRPRKRKFIVTFQGSVSKHSRLLVKVDLERTASFGKNKLLKLKQAISQVNLIQCSLCWHLKDRKDTYLGLRGFRVIRKGHFYDAEPFLTTADIISPCKVQH